MRHLWVILLVVILGGCYSTVPIRPAEVLKVNDMYETFGTGAVYSPTSNPGISIGTVQTGESHIDFVAPDGSTTKVPGYADLYVTTPRRAYRFREIVKVEDEGDRFMIRSSSRTGEIPKSDIRATELRQLDKVETALAVAGAALALTAPLVIFIVTR